jgi:hypothetical protein
MATRFVTLHVDAGDNGGSRTYRFVAEGTVEECEAVVRNALRVGDAARVCLQYSTVATQQDEPEALAPPQYVWAKSTTVAEFKLTVVHTVPVGALRMGTTAPEQMRRGHTAVNKKPETPSLAGQRQELQLRPSLHTVVHDAARPLLKRSTTISARPAPCRARDMRGANRGARRAVRVETPRSGFAFKPWSKQGDRRDAAVAAALTAIRKNCDEDEDEAKVRSFLANWVKNNYCGAKRRHAKSEAAKAAAKAAGAPTDSDTSESESESDDDGGVDGDAPTPSEPSAKDAGADGAPLRDARTPFHAAHAAAGTPSPRVMSEAEEEEAHDKENVTLRASKVHILTHARVAIPGSNRRVPLACSRSRRRRFMAVPPYARFATDALLYYHL